VQTEATVYVVEDDPAVRESLAWVIESAGYRVEAFATAEAFLAAFDPERPACLITDVRMPGMSGLELQKHLAEKRIEIPLIFITAHGTVPAAVRAMRAGAIDYLLKPYNNEALLTRIAQAIGQARKACAERAVRKELSARVALLTPREREVMTMVVSGKSNRTIAAELDLSVKTVETHRASVMTKMQAASLADLVRMVLPERPGGNPEPSR
jgi:FixJ family two-component response regulator